MFKTFVSLLSGHALYIYRVCNFLFNTLYSSERQVDLMHYQIQTMWKDAAASYLKVVDWYLCGGAEVNCEQRQDFLCLRRYSNQTPASTSHSSYRSTFPPTSSPTFPHF